MRHKDKKTVLQNNELLFKTKCRKIDSSLKESQTMLGKTGIFTESDCKPPEAVNIDLATIPRAVRNLLENQKFLNNRKMVSVVLTWK